jgi:hypothetical protein
MIVSSLRRVRGTILLVGLVMVVASGFLPAPQVAIASSQSAQKNALNPVHELGTIDSRWGTWEENGMAIDLVVASLAALRLYQGVGSRKRRMTFSVRRDTLFV